MPHLTAKLATGLTSETMNNRSILHFSDFQENLKGIHLVVRALLEPSCEVSRPVRLSPKKFPNHAAAIIPIVEGTSSINKMPSEEPVDEKVRTARLCARHPPHAHESLRQPPRADVFCKMCHPEYKCRKQTLLQIEIG